MDFLFKNVDQDINRWLEKYAATTPRDEEIIQFGKYGKAERLVLEAYYERKAYLPLVMWQLGMNVVGDYESPKFHQLSATLVESRDVDLLRRLWKGDLAKRRAAYWSIWSYRNKIEGIAEQIEESRRHVLAGYRTYLEALRALNDTATFETVQEELRRFESNEVRKLTTPTDPRKMDDALFWQLLSEGRARGETPDAQIEAVTDALKEFPGPQIRKFQTILNRQMTKLYHYNVWALAFLAQNGCSDDAFEEFRPWLLLQGERICDDAVQDPSRIVLSVPEGLETRAAALLDAPAVAYELRTGKPLVVRRTESGGPKGKAWEESDLPARYPSMWSHYDHLRKPTEDPSHDG